MLGGLSSVMAQSAAEPSPKSGYVVKPGDTLDKVVRAAFPNSPLRPDLLRDEVARLNPAAFTKGSSKVLMAGATLQMPAHDALLSQHLGKAPSGNADATADARRQWVRYP